MKLLVDCDKGAQQALKDGAYIADISEMSVIGTLLKARMEVKDEELDKVDQIDQSMSEQFKSITGVKVTT